MRVMTLIAMTLGFITHVVAQTEQSLSADDFGSLNISVVMPTELPGVSQANLQKIQTKILSLLSQSSISSVNADDGIVLYPVLTLFDEQVINPGTGNMTVIDGELSLFIKQVDDKVVFASSTKRIKGSGRSRDQAMNSLITSIPSRSRDYEAFISDAKAKIHRYYDDRCTMLLSKADQMSKMQNYASALSLLANIPSESSCYQLSKEKTQKVYLQYQNQSCSELLSKAKAEFALKHYESGIDYLSEIDPASKCSAQVQVLYKQYGKEIDQQQKEQWRALEKMNDDQVALEKYRLNTIVKVAHEFRNTHPRTYNYIKIR